MGLHHKVAGMVDELFTDLYDTTIKQYYGRQVEAGTITRIVYTQAFTRQQNASDSYSNVYVCGCHKQPFSTKSVLRVYLKYVFTNPESLRQDRMAVSLTISLLLHPSSSTKHHRIQIDSLHHHASTPPVNPACHRLRKSLPKRLSFSVAPS